MWTVIAEGTSLNDLHSTGAIDKLPHNTPFDIEMRTRWDFMTKVADVAGAEWFAKRLVGAGAVVEDIEEKEGKILVHCRANAVHLLPLLAVIAAVFAAVALFIIAVKISAPVAGAVSIGVVIAIIAAIALVAYLVYRGQLVRLAGR